ncbi:threonine dehydratase [Candidatus Gracilibacteria bacterium]|nr:MAG: threonine dehydratase [Candidatus Gracilibacteria bacterium]PIE85773.1 MAG: threonine dehydratase [Candidatus Gracilibacteria bacterium]
MKKINIEKIKKAKHNFGDFIKTTPLEYSKRLSKEYNANIYLKREDLQAVRSYKVRGAFNLINNLTEKQQKSGVVCASAGNHAQGVAITCEHLKINGTVFMPVTTPEQKVYKTKQFGGKYVTVILVGDTFDEALKNALKFKKETGASFIHPFDDEKIIEGQSTVGLEIFEQFEDYSLKSKSNGELDYIIAPIGGGGFISGIISAKNALNKKTKIIGAEPSGACGMKKSLEAGKNISLDTIEIFVDGAAVKREGDKTFEICNEEQIEIISCPENRVCTTILDYLKEDGIVVEPAGALSTDALKDINLKVEKGEKKKNIVVVISGGNFDFERLPELKERSLKYEGLKKYFIVSFPQRPGALKEFLLVLGEGDDIERFEYLKKSAKNTAPVFIGLKTNNKNNWNKIEKNMKKLGFKYKDVTNDDLYFDLLI